jgi:hypothetical protein
MIAFIQYIRPNGRKREIYIDRPDYIESAASQFIAAGGRFEAEELATGHVSLTAVHAVDDEDQDIVIVIVPNGPRVLQAVDEVVLKAFHRMEKEGWCSLAVRDI